MTASDIGQLSYHVWWYILEDDIRISELSQGQRNPVFDPIDTLTDTGS